MRTLRQKLKETFPFIKIDFVGSNWFEFFINDRVVLLDNVKAIKTFISNYNVRCNITRVWEWKEVTYDNLVFNNPTPTFRFCICKSSKGFSFNTNSIVNVSDTTDPLYDICLLKLQDAMGFPIGNQNRLITNFFRMPYGFAIRGDSLAEVERIIGRNIFDRKMSWSKVGNREYEIRIYMTDKEHLFIDSDKKQKKKIAKVIKTKVDYSKLTKEELIKLLEDRDEQ